MANPKLLGTSYKIEKSNMAKAGYITQIQYLSPASESGYQMCAFRSPACEFVCLGHSSGMMTFSTSKQARINRTIFLMTKRADYGQQIAKEIGALQRKSAKADMLPAMRPNGDSDLRWEDIRFNGETLMEKFPNVQFYDYTKWPITLRPIKYSNYHLTFSRSEHTTTSEIQANLDAGRNVAVVFDQVPESWNDWKVIDGDADDLRFLDPVGVIVGLKAKGTAKKDTSGFVVRLAS